MVLWAAIEDNFLREFYFDNFWSWILTSHYSQRWFNKKVERNSGRRWISRKSKEQG